MMIFDILFGRQEKQYFVHAMTINQHGEVTDEISKQIFDIKCARKFADDARKKLRQCIDKGIIVNYSVNVIPVNG